MSQRSLAPFLQNADVTSEPRDAEVPAPKTNNKQRAPTTKPTTPRNATLAKLQGRDSYVFGSSAMSQANDYFFARKRERFFWPFFFARKREKKNLGIFWVFLFLFFGVLGVFVFVFRALARFFFGFVFCDEPSKAGNLCPVITFHVRGCSTAVPFCQISQLCCGLARSAPSSAF